MTYLLFLGEFLMEKQKSFISVVYILIAASLWGTAGIFIRNLEGTFSQIHMVFGRTVFSSIVFLIIILCKNKKLLKVKLKDLPWFAASGVFSIVMFNFCYYKTMQHTTLSVAAVLLYTAPFFVVFMSTLFFKEKLNLQKILCCILAFVGCCMVSGLFDSSQTVSSKALIYGILTGLGYALYTIFGEILIKKGYDPLTINFYVFLSAAVCCLCITDVPEFTTVSSAAPKGVLILFLMAVINTVLPYLFYTAALKKIETSKAPIIAIAEPVVATLIGTLIFGEEISLISILGIAVVLGAVVILNLEFGEKNGANQIKG